MNRYAWLGPLAIPVGLLVLIFAPSVLAPPTAATATTTQSGSSGSMSNLAVLIMILAFVLAIEACGFWSGWLYLRARPKPPAPPRTFGPPPMSSDH